MWSIFSGGAVMRVFHGRKLWSSFKVNDIYAFLHFYGTTEFDISFVRPEGLELFWSNYELVKNEPGWRDFDVQAVSRQNQVKRVTVMTCNESLSCFDIMTWLSRYGEVVEMPKKNRDEFGIWSGAWTFMVKLKRSGGTVAHIPSSAFLGRDRILVHYQGQPKLCHKCGDPTHFSANCTVQKCALCGDVGHLAASCKEIRCHLCGELGHPFSRCPRSFANTVRTPVGESREADSAGEGTGRGEGAEGPGRKSRQKTPAQLRRLDKRRQERQVGEPRPTRVTPVLDARPAAEAPRDNELDEEARRIHREENATSSESSHYESMDEDNRQWLQEKRKRGTRKKKNKGDVTSSRALTKVPKEGKADSPLVGLSNQFQALEDTSSSEEEDEAEPYSGVAVLFTAPVECRRVIELEMRRCLILDVLLKGQELRLINIYGLQSKWDRKCLFMRIKPYLFTSRQVVFGGDFNSVTRPRDRGGAKGKLTYDSVALNSIASEARLVDVHIRHTPGHEGFTYHRGNCRSRIDRFYLKEEAVSSAVSVVEVEFSDHCLILFSLNVTETPGWEEAFGG
ncbi:LOW QUALITY PROTEIN: uncharacterized protein ACNLHF_009375 [Anomaloglossus baeobatrachus]